MHKHRPGNSPKSSTVGLQVPLMELGPVQVHFDAKTVWREDSSIDTLTAKAKPFHSEAAFSFKYNL